MTSLLDCAVCYSILNDPRVLPCGHTFCGPNSPNACVSKLARGGHILCPLKCKEKSPSDRVENLSVNYSMKQLVESELSHSGDVFCLAHTDEPIQYYCITDKEFICQQCLAGIHDEHQLKLIKKHVESECKSLLEEIELSRIDDVLPKAESLHKLLVEVLPVWRNTMKIKDNLLNGPSGLQDLLSLSRKWKIEKEREFNRKEYHSRISQWVGSFSAALGQKRALASSKLQEQAPKKFRPNASQRDKVVVQNHISFVSIDSQTITVSPDSSIEIFGSNCELLVIAFKSEGRFTAIQSSSIQGGLLMGRSSVTKFDTSCGYLNVEACFKDKYLVSTHMPDSARLYDSSLGTYHDLDVNSIAGTQIQDSFACGDNKLLYLPFKGSDIIYEYHIAENPTKNGSMVVSCRNVPLRGCRYPIGFRGCSILFWVFPGELQCVTFSDTSFSAVQHKTKFAYNVNRYKKYNDHAVLVDLDCGTTVVVAQILGTSEFYVIAFPELTLISRPKLPNENLELELHLGLTGGQLLVFNQDKLEYALLKLKSQPSSS